MTVLSTSHVLYINAVAELLSRKFRLGRLFENTGDDRPQLNNDCHAVNGKRSSQARRSRNGYIRELKLFQRLSRM